MKNKKIQFSTDRVDAEGVHRSLKYSTTPIKYLQELTDNSIEHNSTQIQVTLDEFANCYIVEDNGDGIPSEILKRRYHTMYAVKEDRTGLGFFGVGSMAFKCISDIRITITKNNDGVSYSNWNTKKSVNGNLNGFEINPNDPLPESLMKYEREITRFLKIEEGNGTMVIIPKNDENWGEHNSSITFKNELIEAFENRYQHCLSLKQSLSSLVIRRRTKEDKQYTYKVSSRNVLPDEPDCHSDRCDIKIYTWWSPERSSGKNMIQIYLEGVKVGKVDMLKVGSRKSFVPTNAAERGHIRQAIMCPIKRMHLLEANPIKDNYGIKKDWINKELARQFTKVYNDNNKPREDEQVKIQPVEVPTVVRNIPTLCKAIQNKDGRYLSRYILNLIEDMNNPNVSAISNNRKIERAAQKTLTQNNGGTNE